MINNIINCRKCNLCTNQLPLLDKNIACDIMWVGLSAKRVDDIGVSVPLEENTNSGKIIKQVENKLIEYNFYKTNLVKCLPLDKNLKLRYPTCKEMDLCIENLIYEINILNPKIIFVLGKVAYNHIYKYFVKNNINVDRLFYVEHPSYIYVYKRKYIDEYISKIVNLCIERM